MLQQTAEQEKLEIGDRVGLTTRQGVRRFRITGVFSFGEGGSSLGGTSLMEIHKQEVQRLFALEGGVTSIEAVAQPGTTPEELVRGLRALLPPGLEVETAEHSARESADEINDQIGGFLTPAAAGVRGCGAARRRVHHLQHLLDHRRPAHARVRGAGLPWCHAPAGASGRRRSRRSLIGCLASGAGMAAGVAFASLLAGLFDALGFGIPRSGLVLERRTIVVVARGRHRRHRAGRAVAGSAGHARSAGGGHGRRRAGAGSEGAAGCVLGSPALFLVAGAASPRARVCSAPGPRHGRLATVGAVAP